MRKSFNFGKIAAFGNRKINAVEIRAELRKRGGEPTYKRNEHGEMIPTGNTTPEYYEFSAMGFVWNQSHTDCIMGGQCLDDIVKAAPYLLRNKTFKQLFDLWNNYHLNGMNAGTPEQEKAITEWKAAGNAYDYTAACEMLKARNLYTVNFTGLTVGRKYENEPYTYGHGWVINELPPEIVQEITELLTA